MGFGMLIRGDDGSIFLGALQNSSEDAWHFTTEESMAERYRQWAAVRSPHSDTWIIQILVPKAFIDELQKKRMCYSSATPLAIHDWDAVHEMEKLIQGSLP